MNPRLQATHTKSDDHEPLKNTHHSLAKKHTKNVDLYPFKNTQHLLATQVQKYNYQERREYNTPA